MPVEVKDVLILMILIRFAACHADRFGRNDCLSIEPKQKEIGRPRQGWRPISEPCTAYRP